MKEYFILADIHSFFDEMMTALKKEGFSIENPEHIVIVCGDLLDRGSQSKEVLDFFYNLGERAILIKGNHEELFENIIKDREYHRYDFSNGTMSTIGQLQLNEEMNEYKVALLFDEAIDGYDRRWDELRFKMLDYFEIGKYIFVHGWIPTIEDMNIPSQNNLGVLYDPEWRNANSKRWNRARWANGMSHALEGIIEPGKTIVCGHWHTSYGHKKIGNCPSEFGDDAIFTPFYSEGIIAIDACTAYSEFCNCLHLKESEMYEAENNN